MKHRPADDAPKHPIKLSFHRSNGPVDDAIERLIDMVGGAREPRYIREMILAALKTGRMDAGTANLKMMNTTMKEMRYTAKVFAPYRHIRKVTVFGSARTKPGDLAYDTAVALGRLLKENGYMVISGGGPGIMQAVCEGAGADHSFGVNIKLPFEQKSNPIVDGDQKTVIYKYFFNRKVAFLKEAHAVALFPGGFGTLDEAMETLTLVQTGKHTPIPLVLLEPPGQTYWHGWLDFLKTELVGHGYINPTDLHLFKMVEDVPSAVDHINRFYRRYHSLRYVGDQMVIRLSEPLPAGVLERLSREFEDILVDGGVMRQGPALPDEDNEPEIAALPRLILDFDKASFGRLRMFIDEVNAA